MFRMVVQDSHVTPTSGKVVAQLGHYDPHTKTVKVDTEKASFYLTNGAQPSDRAARLLQKEGVKLPDWVSLSDSDRSRQIRNADKLRKNQPKEEVTEEVAETPADAPAEEAPVAEAAEVSEAPVETEAPEATNEAPADEAEADKKDAEA